MTRYEEFLKNKLSLAPFGIEKGEARSDYFCTPRGAKILGWTGVDGIHYCTIKAFDEMVFAVNPYGDPKRHAFPVAEDFDTFLRLLATLGHEAALEQAHAMTAEAFARWLTENPPTDAQRSAAESLGIAPMDDPHGYLVKLYETFDFDAIPYKKDYYEWVPVDPPKVQEWRVFFSSLGSSGEKGERAGRETEIHGRIAFAGYDWHIPAAYVCTRGIVIDLLAEVPMETVREFYDKWGKIEDDGGFDMGIRSFLSEDDRLAIAAENPFSLTFSPILIVNGRPLKNRHGSGNQHVPFLGESGMEDVLAHYGLPTDKCWMFRRCAFPWATATKPKLRTVTLRLNRKPVSIPGPHFCAESVGDAFPFVHPVTKIRHNLTVERLQSGRLTLPAGMGKNLPDHYVEIAVRIEPEIAPDQLTIRDARPNDPVRTAAIGASDGAASIGIIGGADGPTAVVFGKPRSAGHTAVSALTYSPQEQVDWMLVFRETPEESVDAVLI